MLPHFNLGFDSHVNWYLRINYLTIAISKYSTMDGVFTFIKFYSLHFSINFLGNKKEQGCSNIQNKSLVIKLPSNFYFFSYFYIYLMLIASEDIYYM